MDFRIKQKSFLQDFLSRLNVVKNAVELFNTTDGFKIIPEEYGKPPRRYLSRSKEMIELVKGEVSKVINDYKSEEEKYEGVIYCMFKKNSMNEVVPLYIGKAEKYGKSGNLSENITLGKGKFARWGHGYAYHIGDLSAVAYSHTKAKKPKKYTDWANALFARYPATPSAELKLKEKIYFWMQAWESRSTGLQKDFGPTNLTFLEYQLIGVSTAIFPNEVLNKEGQNR